MTPAGSARPPIPRWDRLIRQGCQSADRRVGGGGAGQEIVGVGRVAPAASWPTQGICQKRFTPRGVCKFQRLAFKKEHEKTDRPVGLLSKKSEE